MEPRDPGVLLVISGPSGTGKSSLCSQAMKGFANLEFSVSHTTRRPREGEVHGVDYFFVDDATFTSMVEEGAFAEWAQVHGHRYGTSIAQVRSRVEQGINLILDIDPQGAAQIKRKYENAVFIFFLPPSRRELEKRLRGRKTEDERMIQTRLRNSVDEIRQCTWYDYIIINDELSRAVDKFKAIIRAEKCRRSRSSLLIGRVMKEYERRDLDE